MRYYFTALGVIFIKIVLGQSDTIHVQNSETIQLMIQAKQTFFFSLSDSTDQKKIEGYYEAGKKRGLWIFYQEGEVGRRAEYINDSIVKITIYNSAGVKEWNGTLLNGRREGEWYKYSQKRVQLFIYKQGMILAILPRKNIMPRIPTNTN